MVLIAALKSLIVKVSVVKFYFAQKKTKVKAWLSCLKGAKTLSIMTLSVKAFSIMAFSIMTFSIMTFNITILTTHSIMTLTINDYFVTISINDTHINNNLA